MIRNRYQGFTPHQRFFEHLDELQPTEEVRVPRDLAERIFALADLHERRQRERAALGPIAAAQGVFRAQVTGVVKEQPSTSSQ